ncbi:MAG: protein kinase domain-containing protein [Myxococcota bacterium]
MSLGGYEIIRSLGKGSFGEVFLALAGTPGGFQKQVAVKRLRETVTDDLELVERFAIEARICGYLHHPNIIHVYNFQDSPDGYLLIMEYLDGCDLRQLLNGFRRDRRVMPVSLALELAIQLCEGLYFAHVARGADGTPLGLVHRDIKPSNLMVTRAGILKIMDFGVARADFARTRSGYLSVKGTLQYMAPEQAAGGRIDATVDQFAVGLILAEMILGYPLYQAELENQLYFLVGTAAVEAPLAVIREHHPELADILTRLMALNPANRYSDLKGVAGVLRAELAKRNPPPPSAEVVEALLREERIGTQFGVRPEWPLVTTARKQAQERLRALARGLGATDVLANNDEEAPSLDLQSMTREEPPPQEASSNVAPLAQELLERPTEAPRFTQTMMSDVEGETEPMMPLPSEVHELRGSQVLTEPFIQHPGSASDSGAAWSAVSGATSGTIIHEALREGAREAAASSARPVTGGSAGERLSPSSSEKPKESAGELDAHPGPLARVAAQTWALPVKPARVRDTGAPVHPPPPLEDEIFLPKVPVYQQSGFWVGLAIAGVLGLLAWNWGLFEPTDEETGLSPVADVASPGTSSGKTGMDGEPVQADAGVHTGAATQEKQVESSAKGGAPLARDKQAEVVTSKKTAVEKTTSLKVTGEKAAGDGSSSRASAEVPRASAGNSASSSARPSSRPSSEESADTRTSAPARGDASLNTGSSSGASKTIASTSGKTDPSSTRASQSATQPATSSSTEEGTSATFRFRVLPATARVTTSSGRVLSCWSGCTLPPGPHQVKIEHPDGRVVSWSFELESGTMLSCLFNFDRDTGPWCK